MVDQFFALGRTQLVSRLANARFDPKCLIELIPDSLQDMRGETELAKRPLQHNASCVVTSRKEALQLITGLV